MFEVYFEASNKNKRLLDKVNTTIEVSKVIQDFLKDHNFKSYYWRYWRTPEGDTYVDVGSHTEFFVIKEIKDE